MQIETYKALGLNQPAPAEANGRSNADIQASLNRPEDRIYHPCPEASPPSDTARGRVTPLKDFSDSSVFPGTVRDMWVYQTAEHEQTAAHNLIVFQDGAGYLSRTGPVRATNVLDCMRANSEIPPTLALFINPGRPPGTAPMFASTSFEAANRQRSFEYDSITPDYGEFLLRDAIPAALAATSLNITGDPEKRLLCGISSGGICAFNAAWHHPQEFGAVLSHCGSYTNIAGGHNVPYLVRTTPRKPLRVFLQSGANDAETLFGNWPLANQTMADALRYAGYDYRFEFGVGGHTLRHGGALFADSLRWLWPESASV